MLIATAVAEAGIAQMPVTGKLRIVLAESGGPPDGPGGSRGSATRQGGRGKRLGPGAMLIAPFVTERPPLSTVSLTALSEVSLAAAAPVVVMTRLIVPFGQPVRLNTIAPIRSPGAGAAVNGMSPLVSAEE